MIKRIISGGQTGADRAALDFAIKVDLPHGGWVPKGRLAEDGTTPARYHLTEMPSKSYAKRTEKNVVDSDGTLIVSHGKLKGGSQYTMDMAIMHSRPWLYINLDETTVLEAAQQVIDWLLNNRIKTLNVAGPRESKDPMIYRAVYDLLQTVYYIAISEENFVALRGTGMPKTVDEAVKRLIANMPLKVKSEMAKMEESELIDLHFSFGAFIRNQFGLWSGNEDLLNDCRQKAGITFMHHDDAAAFIIGELWERLRKTHQLRVVKWDAFISRQ
jgi:hypothetical protein